MVMMEMRLRFHGIARLAKSAFPVKEQESSVVGHFDSKNPSPALRLAATFTLSRRLERHLFPSCTNFVQQEARGAGGNAMKDKKKDRVGGVVSLRKFDLLLSSSILGVGFRRAEIDH